MKTTSARRAAVDRPDAAVRLVSRQFFSRQVIDFCCAFGLGGTIVCVAQGMLGWLGLLGEVGVSEGPHAADGGESAIGAALPPIWACSTKGIHAGSASLRSRIPFNVRRLVNWKQHTRWDRC